MIHLKDVTVIRNGKYLLKGIDWDVNKGEHWAILGLNGSGKTSLLNVINGYLYPTSGKVEVLDQEFGKTNIPELRKEIGFISSSLKQQLKDYDIVLSVVLSGIFASIGLYEAVEKKMWKWPAHSWNNWELNIWKIPDTVYYLKARSNGC